MASTTQPKQPIDVPIVTHAGFPSEQMQAWIRAITPQAAVGPTIANATFFLRSADSNLPNARVGVDSATVTLDYSTPGQVKWNSVNTGTVTTTGTPASGNLTKFSGASSITNGDLSGDVSTSGTLVTTLANTAVTPGTYGDSTHVGQFTVDAKGRLTFAQNVAISGGGSSTDYVVLGNGVQPPTPLDDGAGSFIYVGYMP